jgi:hypothetical protein
VASRSNHLHGRAALTNGRTAQTIFATGAKLASLAAWLEDYCGFNSQTGELLPSLKCFQLQ